MNEKTDPGMNAEMKGPPASRSRRIPWLPLIFAVLTVITFFMAAGELQGGPTMYGMRGVSNEIAPATPPSYTMESGTSAGSPGSMGTTHATDAAYSGAGSANSAQAPQAAVAPMPPNYYPDYPPQYYAGQPAATDTREFLKMDYQATVRTLHVQDLARRIETVVSGHGGRIDQISSSPSYGSISFAMPQDKFDDFRTEFEGMVNWRFLTVDISSQNLLPQKQGIEAQTTQASSSLADLSASRKKLVATHASTVSSLQSQIDADSQELASLEAQSTTDPNQQAQITAEIQSVSADQRSLKSRLANENANYASNLQNTDSSIKYTQANLDSIKTQDQNLTDTVATVSGTISLSSITLWQIAMLYLPGYSIPLIFAVLTILSYLYDRRRYGPSILGF